MRNRPSWDELFIKIAKEVAERSTCSRIQVGSVLVKNNRIISIGYNGSHPEGKHCDKYWEDVYNEPVWKSQFSSLEVFLESKAFKDMHHDWAEENEIHAEQNVLAASAKAGISTEGSTMYVTYSPCIHCSKLISQSGVASVKYLNKYERDTRGLDFLKECKIECSQVEEK